MGRQLSANPPRGSFGGAVIAGAHDGDPSRLLATEPVLGMVRDSTYFYATLRDESGTLYPVMRRRSDPAAWPTRLWLRAASSTAGLDRFELPQRSAAAASVIATAGGDGVRFTAEAHNGDEPLACLVTATDLTWEEGSILHLGGRDISPGLQWHLPDVDGSMLYTSRLFVVKGHVAGTPVRGIAGVDDVHLSPGRRNYVDDPITRHHLSTAWCTWATCYDDGTAESGHVAFGPGRFGFAIRSTSEGDIAIGRRIDGDVTHADGLPAHATFDIDDTPWDFTIDPFGRCAPAGGPVLQAEGLFQRRGETRHATTWSASLEVPA